MTDVFSSLFVWGIILDQQNLFMSFKSSQTLSKKGTYLVGFGFDGTACFRKGARLGPSAIREASYGVETFSPYLNLDLEDPRNSLLHQTGGAGGGELLSPEQHQQMSQQQQQTMGLANDVVLSETHDIKHFVPDQKPREQQYIVTSDQQRLIHDHR